MVSEYIGSTGRLKRKKKKIESIKRETDRLIERTLTCINSPHIDIAVYQSQITNLLTQIEQSSKTASEFRAARAHLSGYIDKGNADQVWSLPVPAYPIRVTAGKNFRTENWFHLMSKIAGGYKAINEYLKDSKEPISDENALSMCLFSAAIHGGLCEANLLVAFANTLTHQKKPLHNEGQKYWVNLKITEPVMSTNSRDIHGQEFTFKRWYPDANTMLWIYRVKCTKVKPVKVKFDAIKVLSRLKNLFKMVQYKEEFKKNSLQTFLKSCIGITETLPGVQLPSILSQYAIGSIQAASLPERQYEYLQTNQRLNDQKKSVTVNIQDFDEIKYSFNGLPATKIMFKVNNAALVRELKKALSGDFNSSSKQTSGEALKALINIKDHEARSFMTSLFLDWLIWLLKDKKLKPSSLYRYYSSIGKKWFEASQNFDPENKEAEDYLSLYEGIIDGFKNEKSKRYGLGRIMQLHEFGVITAGLPYISFDRAKSFAFVNAGYIPEGLYNQLNKSLGSLQGATKELIDAYKGIAILAMRTGMRKGEILKLRLIDIEKSPEMYVFIRNNSYGDNKSSSGLRKIPLRSLLLPEELEHIRSFIQVRREYYGSKRQALLFSLDISPFIQLNSHQVTRVFNFILRELSSVDYTFHHFRHTALSNLQLILSSSIDELQRYQPYNIELARSIWRGIAPRKFENNNRDTYWILAGMAGHASPETTMGTYLHFNTELMHEALSKQNIQKSSVFLTCHIGLPKNAVAIRRKEENISSGLLPASLFTEYISNKLLRFSNEWRQDEALSMASNDAPQDQDLEEEKIKVCVKLLELYEQGASNYEINRYLMEKRWVESSSYLNQSYIESAISLSDLKTNKGDSRLFSKYLMPVPRGKRVLPIKPRNHSDLIDANRVIMKLRSECHSHKLDIDWCVKYFIHHTDRSSSSIKFTSKGELERFLKTMLLVTKENRWFVKLSLNPGSKREWKIQASSKLKTRIIKLNKVKKNRADLYFLHANNRTLIRESDVFEKYSSTSLRYVFHMLAIIMNIT